MSTEPAPSTYPASERRFELLVESIQDYAIYMLDCAGHILTWNPGAQQNKGYTRQEIIGKPLRTMFVPEDVTAGVPERELATALEKGRCAGEGWRLRKNGERFWASFVITTMREPSSGKLVGFAKVTIDISDRKRHQDALLSMEVSLRAERDRLHAAAESSMDTFYICDAVRDETGEIDDFIFTYLNDNVVNMLAIPREDILGERLCDLFPITRSSGLLEQYRRVVHTGEPHVQELPLQLKGADVWLRLQAVKLHDGIAVTSSDITDRKCYEEHIRHQAQHDSLTGLPNRSLLHAWITKAIEMARDDHRKAAVLLIDLDDFKTINDTLGHLAGDTVLFSAAARLKSVLRESDSVIRIGGDEFILILPNIHGTIDAELCAGRIRRQFQDTLYLCGHTVRLSCSIGHALYPDEGDTTEALIAHADARMYSDKRNHRHPCELLRAV